MTPIELLEWVVNLLGGDLQSIFISLVSLAIVLAIIFMVRTLSLDRAYDRYERQFAIIFKHAPDIFIRLAFPDVDDITLLKKLVDYAKKAEDRELDGLSWIDPRLLYAIDKVELAIPEGYRIDLNIIIDTMETIYQKMDLEGEFAGRTDGDLPEPE